MIPVNNFIFLKTSLRKLRDLRKKDEQLSSEAAHLTEQATKIKANIKLVILGLKELQSIRLEGPRKPQNRDIFA